MEAKYDTKPSFLLSLNFVEAMHGVKGAGLQARCNVGSREQSLSALVKVEGQDLRFSLDFTLPLYKRLFEFISKPRMMREMVYNELEQQRFKVEADLVVKASKTRNLFFGTKVMAKIPKDSSDVFYHDVSASFGMKEDSFEGVVYARKFFDKRTLKEEEKICAGGYLTTKREDLTVGCHAEYEANRPEDDFGGISLESVTSLERNGSVYSFKAQVMPSTAFSFAYATSINPSTKVSVGYTYTWQFGKKSDVNKRTAFSFSLQLLN